MPHLAAALLVVTAFCVGVDADPVTARDTDAVFDYEIARLKSEIKNIEDLPLDEMEMTIDGHKRIMIQLELLRQELALVELAKVSTDTALRREYARAILNKHDRIYSFSLDFRTDHASGRQLGAADLHKLREDLAAVKKLQASLGKRRKMDVDGNK